MTEQGMSNFPLSGPARLPSSFCGSLPSQARACARIRPAPEKPQNNRKKGDIPPRLTRYSMADSAEQTELDARRRTSTVTQLAPPLLTLDLWQVCHDATNGNCVGSDCCGAVCLGVRAIAGPGQRGWKSKIFRRIRKIRKFVLN